MFVSISSQNNLTNTRTGKRCVRVLPRNSSRAIEDMDIASRGFARGSYTNECVRVRTLIRSSPRVRVASPAALSPCTPFPAPPLMDGGTVCYAGGKGSNGDTQSRSHPHSHALHSRVAQAFLAVSPKCNSEMCARLPSTIAHSPLGGIEKMCEYALFPRPQTGVGTLPPPSPPSGRGAFL